MHSAPIPLLLQITGSTAFDFATKDPCWNAQYGNEANRLKKVGSKRPQSASGGFRGSLSSSISKAKSFSGPPISSSGLVIGGNLTKSTSQIPKATPGVGAASKPLHPDSKMFKQLKRALSFRQMHSERSKVVSKLDAIEKQRKKIQEDYKSRPNSASADIAKLMT